MVLYKTSGGTVFLASDQQQSHMRVCLFQRNLLKSGTVWKEEFVAGRSHLIDMSL